MISPLAYIHPEAKIGENVEIAPFVFIDKNVVIGDNNKIMANANILYGSRIGNGNTIFPGAVIGAIPQDLKFRGEESTAEIGDNNLIRENVTINRGTAAKGRTIVGNNNLLMEGVHVATTHWLVTDVSSVTLPRWQAKSSLMITRLSAPMY